MKEMLQNQASPSDVPPFQSVAEAEPEIWACNETFNANCICLWAN